MPLFAKIENGIVAQLAYAGDANTAAPDGFVVVPTGTAIGAQYNAGAIVYPTAAILQSPDGTPFRVTVEDDGSLATEEITQ